MPAVSRRLSMAADFSSSPVFAAGPTTFIVSRGDHTAVTEVEHQGKAKLWWSWSRCGQERRDPRPVGGGSFHGSVYRGGDFAAGQARAVVSEHGPGIRGGRPAQRAGGSVSAWCNTAG